MSEQTTVTYYWIATIEKPNGDKIHCHSTADSIPGSTRAAVTRDILAFLTNRHGDYVLLFFSLEPNQLSAPAVPQ